MTGRSRILVFDRSGDVSVTAGFRRRILIEPGADVVSAALEDDYHHMQVALRHAEGVVVHVEPIMIRAPWTSCPGAPEVLRETFLGQRLTDFARRGERLTNCTHLHDLALFAAAHATGERAVAYDIFVSDPNADGQREARLIRDGEQIFRWLLEDRLLIAPANLAGLSLGDLRGWIADLDPPGVEAARILRWAAILALGRTMTIPAGMAATAFPLGTCYTFQSVRAEGATRLPGADVDFSRPGLVPLAQRADAFTD